MLFVICIYCISKIAVKKIHFSQERVPADNQPASLFHITDCKPLKLSAGIFYCMVSNLFHQHIPGSASQELPILSRYAPQQVFSENSSFRFELSPYDCNQLHHLVIKLFLIKKSPSNSIGIPTPFFSACICK